MRLITELNKIGKQLLGDTSHDGYHVPGAPPPPLYAQSPQHAMSYPPPSAPSLPYPPTSPHHQSTWPPPNGPVHGAPQSPPFNPAQFPVSSAPAYSTGYTAAPQTYTAASPPQPYTAASPPQTYTAASPPQTYTAASPPQAFSPPPSFAPYPSPPHSSPPQSFTSPHATHVPSHNHSHSLPIPSPPVPATQPSHNPADWLVALQDLLPLCFTAARDHVASAHLQPDTIWLYFVDLGPGQYFADAVYGIDGNAFAKDDLAWAGVPPNPERSTALFRILAGEWVTKICLRSKVEEAHPSRVVVRMDVASRGFGSTMCYEVASVRHPTLSPAQVLTLWVARLKATGDDSADFMPA